jgi:hypothetical protein
MEIKLTDKQVEALLETAEFRSAIIKEASERIAKGFDRKPIHKYVQERIMTPDFQAALQRSISQAVLDKTDGKLELMIENALRNKIKAAIGSKFGVVISELLKVTSAKEIV